MVDNYNVYAITSQSRKGIKRCVSITMDTPILLCLKSLKKKLPQGEQVLTLTASQTGEVVDVSEVSMLGKTMELICLLNCCFMHDLL